MGVAVNCFGAWCLRRRCCGMTPLTFAQNKPTTIGGRIPCGLPAPAQLPALGCQSGDDCFYCARTHCNPIITYYAAPPFPWRCSKGLAPTVWGHSWFEAWRRPRSPRRCGVVVAVAQCRYTLAARLCALRCMFFAHETMFGPTTWCMHAHNDAVSSSGAAFTLL